MQLRHSLKTSNNLFHHAASFPGHTVNEMSFYGGIAFLFTCLLLFLICFWVPPSDDTHKTDWAIGLTDSTKLWIALLPSIILVLFGILFRGILPPTEKKKKDVEGTESQGLVSHTGAARYDAVDADTEVALQGVGDSRQDDGGVSDGEQSPALFKTVDRVWALCRAGLRERRLPKRAGGGGAASH